MDTILADVRSGLRMLATYPALSLVAVLTLGLGIGLSTTVFCVVNGGIFKGLPFPDAGSAGRLGQGRVTDTQGNSSRDYSQCCVPTACAGH